MEPEITLVIPSYERHPYLRRQLLYYVDKPLHIVIADGSSVAWEDGDSGARGQMTWEYFHIPGFDTYTQRLQLAMERVPTEFMFLIDDQECILWTGVLRAVDNLRENPDHSCAGGRVAITAVGAEGLHLCSWGRWSEPWGLLEPRALDRFRSLVEEERTANLYYQVFRAADMRRYLDVFSDYRASYIGAGEIAPAAFRALSGKWVMDSYPFWIRHGESLSRPASALNPMSETEVSTMAKKLVALTTQAGPPARGVGGEGHFDADDLAQLISAKWGPYGDSDGRSSKGFVARRVGQSWSSVRGFLARILQVAWPSYYERLRARRELQAGEVLGAEGRLTFGEYAIRFGAGYPGVAADLLRIEKIWNEFPNGVPESGSFPTP
jgi:glycosyltransferase domain-containing protein